MAHRGRISVLAHVMGKPLPLILGEFQGKQVVLDFIYTGCADACTDLGKNFQKIQAELPTTANGKAPLLLLSISFDSV